MNKPVILLGNGGHASVLSEILITQKRTIIGYTAPQKEHNLHQFPYLGTDAVITNYGTEEIELVLGMGSVKVTSQRRTIFDTYKALGYQFSNVIHTASIVSPSVVLGEGVQIMAGVILQTNVTILDNTIINSGCIVDHDCSIGKHVHLAPGTTLSGGVNIGESCHIGTGTSIIQGISVGEQTLVGAGSVVVRDIGRNKKVVGVPAKEV